MNGINNTLELEKEDDSRMRLMYRERWNRVYSDVSNAEYYKKMESNYFLFHL